MAPTTLKTTRLAALLAHAVAACSLPLMGCALEAPSPVVEEISAPEAGPSGLGIGSSGEDVRAVYAYLQRYGYFENEELAEHYPDWYPAVSREPADPEVFDAALEEGVLLFQAASGLPATGIVDA